MTKLIVAATGAALLIISAWAVLLEVRHGQCRRHPDCECEFDIDWSGWPR